MSYENRKPKNDKIVTGIYPQGKTGRFYYGPTIKPAHFDNLQSMLNKAEIGGRFRVRFLSDEELQDKQEAAQLIGKDPSQVAPAFIEFISKEEVEANKAEWERKKAEQGL